MKLKFYEIDGREYYEASIFEGGNTILLSEYYTTKSEAIKTVKASKKSYKGNGALDCCVKHFDGYGCAIETYTI